MPAKRGIEGPASRLQALNPFTCHMEEENRIDKCGHHSFSMHSDMPTHKHASAGIYHLTNLINMLFS